MASQTTEYFRNQDTDRLTSGSLNLMRGELMPVCSPHPLGWLVGALFFGPGLGVWHRLYRRTFGRSKAPHHGEACAASAATDLWPGQHTGVRLPAAVSGSLPMEDAEQVRRELSGGTEQPPFPHLADARLSACEMVGPQGGAATFVEASIQYCLWL